MPRGLRVESAPVLNGTWAYVAVLYAVAVWAARRRGVALPWRVAALFYALVLIFLFRPMTQAYVNVPSDFVQILPPWNGYLHKQAVANKEMNDLTMQIIPWAHQAREAWRSLQFPVWNDLSGGGYPLLANGQSSAMSPLRLLALPLPLGYAFTAEAAMKLLIALTFMYLFCRRRYGAIASIVGAISFAFCTFNSTWLHFPIVTVSVWLPAALLAVDLLLESRSYARFVFAVVVWSVMLYGGHPETVSHVTFLCGLYVLWIAAIERPVLFRDSLRSMLTMAAAIAVAAIIAAPFLITFAETVTKSKRFDDLKARPNVSNAVPYSDYPSMVVLFQPSFYGHLPSDKPWGPATAESITGFAGIMGIASFFALLIRTVRRRQVRNRELFFVMATIIVVAVMLGSPVVSWLFHLIFRLAANARLRLLFCFLLALMTAAALDIALNERRSDLLGGCTMAAAMLLALLTTTRFPSAPLRDIAVLAILPSVLVLALSTLLTSARTRTIGVAALTTAIVAELWTATAGWNPVLPAQTMYPVTPLIARLQTLAGPGTATPVRIVGLGPALFPNTNAIYGLEDIRAHDPMANGRYLGLMRLVTGLVTFDYFAKWDNTETTMLDYLNVRYLVGRPGVTVADGVRYGHIYQGKDGEIFENRDVLPRFFAARNIVLEFRSAPFLAKLASHTDWAHTAMVKVLPVDSDRMRQDLLAPRPLNAPETSVVLLPSTRTDFRMRVHAPRHSLIVSSQPWWRGWQVTRNGKTIEPQPVNGVFLGFTVPPGDWDVRVHYVPTSFYVGLAMSLATIALLVAAGMRRRTRIATAGGSASAPIA